MKSQVKNNIFIMLCIIQINSIFLTAMIPATSNRLARSGTPAFSMNLSKLINTLSNENDSTINGNYKPQVNNYNSLPTVPKFNNSYPTKSIQNQQRLFSTQSTPSINLEIVPHEQDRLFFIQKYLNDFKKENITINISKPDLLIFSNSILQNCSYQEITDTLEKSKQIALENENKTISLKDLGLAHRLSLYKTNYPESIHIKSTVNKENLKEVAFHEAGHTVALVYQSNILLPGLMNVKPYTISKTVSSHGSILKRHMYPPETINSAIVTNPLIGSEIAKKEIILNLAGVVTEQMFGFLYHTFNEDLLTNRSEILKLLGNFSAKDDMEVIWNMLSPNFSPEDIENILISFYRTTYEFLYKYKKSIKLLAKSVLNSKDLALSEKEIFEILHAPTPLERWEHGPLQEEFQNHYDFRNFSQPNTYGYNEKGTYIGTEGYRDKNGDLEELY